MTPVRFTTELVSPKRALQYLESSIGNRAISKLKVSSYAEAMLRGEWKENGQPIIFDENNKLMNGHHRLSAIVEAGEPVKMAVARGVSRDSGVTIDQGMKWTPGHLLCAKGIDNYNIAASIAGLVIMYDKGMMGSITTAGRRPRGEDILEFSSGNILLQNSVRVASKMRHIATTTPVGAAHYIFSKIDPMQADQFMEYLADGANLGKGHPVYRLREQLIRYKTTIGRIPIRTVFAVIIKAWNSYRAGENDRGARIFAYRETESEFPKAV